MKKALHMKSHLIVVVFLLSLSMAWAQQPTFKDGIRTGQIKVKFKSEMSSTLSQTNVNARTSGFTSGIQSIDDAAKATKASNMYRLFPFDARHESKLRKHGLHLWYIVEIDQSTDPKTAVAQFKQLNEVAVAELEHEKILAPYEVKSYVPTAGTFDALPFNDPMLKDQWHYNNSGQVGVGDADVNLFEAWQSSTGSNSVIVSVHDQGVDVKHTDLKANIWVNAGEIAGNGIDDDANGYVDDINGYNFQKNNGAIDPENHGTHVAGTIAAVNNNGIGVSGIAGGNGSGNGVKIMSLQILGGAPIEKSFVYAANNGAVVSQNSWGYSSPGYFDQSVLDAIDYFIEEAGNYDGSPMKGGLVLFAAGNNDYDAPWYPGYYPSTMTVASIGPEWKKAVYSNYGNWVEISAPGGASTTYGATAGVLSTIPKDQYAYMQGTSMACPHMSGIAALALANRTKQITNTELWNKLVTGVVNIDKQNPNYIGKLGSGAIDAAKAIKNDQGIAPIAITNVTATDVAQEFAILTWTVPTDTDDAQPLTFNIYYGIDTVTAANLVAASKVTIKNDSVAGKTIVHEVDNLLGLRQYDFVVTSVDRWGNESLISNVLEITTNDGPAIAVTPTIIGASNLTNPPGTYTWVIDAAVSKTSTQNLTIQNNASGLLRYSSFMRPRVPVASPTSVGDDVIYPIASASSSSSTIGRAGVEEDNVVKLYSNEPAPFAYTTITKKLISGSPTNLIGETDTTLPNSAAAKFDVKEAGGFNLTRVTMTLRLTRAATVTEPVVVEIYKGGLAKENRLLAQAYTTNSLLQHNANITLSEQLYFAQDESFYVVFHIPNGNLFPLGMGFDADPNLATEGYYSSNVGTTWQVFDDAINDKRFAWAMEAFSGNADIGTYLSLAPASGDISGMNSSVAVITADANNLINGNYQANLVLPSNDGSKPELRVPVYLQVKNHQPNVKMIDVVDYSTAFVGSKKSFDIVMDNQGYGRIASMTAAGSYALSGAGASQFIVENSSPVFRPSAIPARDQAIVRVTYAPNTAGPANATLTITGRSGTNVLYTYTVSLFGVGAETSKIALTPETQIKTPLAIGQTVPADITVQNIGGYPLKYFIPGYDTKGVSDNWPAAYQKYGYKLRTSYVTDPNPITNQFQDIKTTGVDITSQIMTDKTWATVDMGFDFPYYNKVMKTIYVAQKGFTAFDNALRPLNTPTLNRPGTTPKGVISLLGTFLTYAAQGKVYYQKEADRLIIQYDNVTDGGGASLTAQMVLFSNGDIRFYYNNMTAWPTNKRQYLNIMVEDYDQKDGILIHDYTKLLTLNNGTAIGLDYPGPNIITSITNGSGILAPGASATVTVHMNTATLVEGLLNRSINFISNDPTNGQKSAIIQLDITSGGSATPIVSTDNIAFGNVFQGAIRSKVFTIKNNGTANVNVTSMTFANGAFNLSASSEAAPLDVKPGYYKNFTVEIPTGTVASLSDDLVITYADASTYTIHVTGNVIDAPAITADLTAVNQTLNYKETASIPYSIQNTGAAPLEVSITGKQWATFDATGSTPAAVTYDVEKHNTGGVYQWIDIRKTGVHLDLSGDVFTPEDYWNEIDLPFPFEFYGIAYSKIKLGLNGVASFDVAPPVMIFSDSVPSKLYEGAYLMPYWSFSGFSDFYPLEDFGIFYQTYEDKVIITWSYMVNNFGGMGNPMSTQMFLYKNGTVKFQYRIEDAGNGGDFTSQFTFIGLQRNSTDGIMISPKIALDYGTNTGLAYILTPEKKHAVAAGATLTGDINFNSHNVYGGVYNASLKIKSNAPNNELKLKSVQLTVNGTPLYMAPDSVNYGSLMINNPTFNQKYFEIKNTGSAPLVITNMRRQIGNAQRMNVAAWQYVYNPFPPVGYNWQFADITGLFCTGCANAPISVGANETLRMMVEHNPNNAQNYNEGLIVTSNAGIDTIRLTSTAYRAPGLVVTTTPINETMNTLAEVVERKIPFSSTNTNNGQGNLNYTVAIEFGRATTSSSSTETKAVTTSSTHSLTKNAASNGGTSTSSVNSYNRAITYTDKTLPDTWVGTGGSSPFVVATKYNSGPTGFSLSHVETFFRAQSLAAGKVLVEIRAGGTSVATSTKVTEGSYTFTASGEDEYGSWITVPMDKVGGIYPNEDFYVIVTSPLGIQLPQGTISDLTTTGGRYYYYDYTESQWYDINAFNGFETLGWLMLAGEETAGITSWLNITSALDGSNAPGVKDTVRLTINSHYALRGDQIANIVLTTNDPLKKITKIPVSLHVNEAPVFGNVPEAIVTAEGETYSITMAVTDLEGNTFTVSSPQSYPGVTYLYADGVLSLTVAPDYGDAGMYSYVFTATDQHNAVREIVIPSEVVHTNRAPEFIGQDVMSFNATGRLNEFTIDDFFSDPDGDEFSYSLTSSNVDVVVVFGSEGSFLIKPIAVGESKLAFTVTDSFGAITKDTVTVMVDIVLAAEESFVNRGLGTHPNPATQVTTVTVTNDWTGEVSLSILDAVGKRYITQQMGAGTREAILDVSTLPNGIYIIKAVSNNQQAFIKFIKK